MNEQINKTQETKMNEQISKTQETKMNGQIATMSLCLVLLSQQNCRKKNCEKKILPQKTDQGQSKIFPFSSFF